MQYETICEETYMRETCKCVMKKCIFNKLLQLKNTCT